MDREQKAQKLELILKELRRRSDPSSITFFDPSFEAQYNAITDKSRFKAYNCTRRAGKTSGFVKEQLFDAWTNPKTNHVFAALTKSSAQDIAWDIYIDELKKSKIRYWSNENRGVITLGNGSRIQFKGFDVSFKEMRKSLGTKLKSIGIDEAGSMTIDMVKLIYQVIMPALSDLRGDLCLMGTCENIPNTFFEKVTNGEVKDFKVFKWDTSQNPYMAEQWAEDIARLKENNPNIESTSWFQTHYLNKWVHDDELLLYRLTDHNFSEVLPEMKQHRLVVDLGYNDESAFTVQADGQDNLLYIVTAFKKSEMTLDSVAQTVKEYQKKYPISRVIIDGANKQGIETMRARYGIPFESAKKDGKIFHIKQLRDDIKLGKIKLLRSETVDLINECNQLQFKDKTNQEEDPRCANHLCDTMLYGYRESFYFMSGFQEDRPPDRDSEEFILKELLGEKNENYW